ncbi:MAG TPA: EamA family transporter [Spirochaetia bacterium]|nr:EamA family transporter [Spirochaetia bacterium]
MRSSPALTSGPSANTAPRGQGTAILAVAGCALLWSTGGLFVKMVDWNPFAIAGVRSLIGGLVILAFLRRPVFTWSFAQVAGGVCYAACMVGFVSATKLTTAANAILLQYTAPIWAALLGWAFLRERVKTLDWIAMAVVVGGMVLFFMDSLSLGGMEGNLLAIVSGMFFAGAMVSFRAQKDGSSLESILLSHGITFLVSLPFLFGAWPGWRGLGALGFLGVFQIGVSAVLLNYGIKQVTAVQSLLTAMIEPLFNPVWVLLFIGERPGPRALAGGAVILVAVTVRSLLSLRSAAGPTRHSRRNPRRASG